MNKLKKAIKIVNAYGGAITKGTELNKIIVESFQNKSPGQHLEALKKKGAYFYALQNKFDISLLPFDKKTIQDAIELLIEDETDSEKISSLNTGLMYLQDFIDIEYS